MPSRMPLDRPTGLRRNAWRLGAAGLGLLLAAVGARGAEVRPGSIATRDGTRTYLVATPAGPAMAGRPLVLLLHGHTGSARHTLAQGPGTGSPLAQWLAIADREGLVVAALDGARGADGQPGWNDGRPGGSGNPTTDDAGFVRAVIAKLGAELRTDPRRTYLMGMSNGGVMALRLAAETDAPLAAVAVACASMPGDRLPEALPRPLSVLLIEGTEDPLMPYAGGQVRALGKSRGAVLGTEATLAFWRRADALDGEPRREEIPHRKESPAATRAVRLTWGRAEGPQVQLLRIEGGGHAEPSLTRRYGLVYRTLAGLQNADLESAEEAWAFFRDKPAP